MSKQRGLIPDEVKQVDFPEDKRAIVPYGTNSCGICNLPIEYLKGVHHLRYEKEYTYVEIQMYIAREYKLSMGITDVTNHFLKHSNVKLRFGRNNKLSKLNQELVEAINEMPKGVKLNKQKEIEVAYEQIVKMSADFADKLSKINAAYVLDGAEFDRVKAQFKGMTPLEVMERLGRLHKELRDQIKDISALRAPKVMVAQFLETCIDEVIYETGVVLSIICNDLQRELAGVFRSVGTSADVLNSKTFAKIFKDAALQYKEKMSVLSREQMHKAISALADLEKII